MWNEWEGPEKWAFLRCVSSSRSVWDHMNGCLHNWARVCLFFPACVKTAQIMKISSMLDMWDRSTRKTRWQTLSKANQPVTPPRRSNKTAASSKERHYERGCNEERLEQIPERSLHVRGDDANSHWVPTTSEPTWHTAQDKQKCVYCEAKGRMDITWRKPLKSV